MPIEVLDGLVTSSTLRIAREVIAAEAVLLTARRAAEDVLGCRADSLSPEAARALRDLVRGGGDVEPETSEMPREAFALKEATAHHARLVSRLELCLQEELSKARASLLNSCREVLPRYLVFGTGGVRELQQRLLREEPICAEALPHRNAKGGDRERHLLLYLQRVSAKNDTLSEFGPTVWGRLHSGAVQFEGRTGIARRLAYLERWTAHAVAAAMNADPDVRPEIAPRINPNGRIEADCFVLSNADATVPLDPPMLELLAKCDGKTPAHALRADPVVLHELAAREVLRWQMEVPALQAHAFRDLASAVQKWRDTPVRARWLRVLQPLADLPRQFAAAASVGERVRIMDEARAILGALGQTPQRSHRVLYSATNPIGEECGRDWDFVLPEQMTDDFARDAAPWIDLWRDTYAFVASRVAEGLRHLLSTGATASDVMPLPAFLKHCAGQNMPLTGHGMVALAHLAFQEVKAAFHKSLSDRPDAEEWELTGGDCSLLRRTFEFPAFAEYTYPSADLQISAESFQAVARGDYRWILSELHPPVAMLHQCFYWNCPDPARLAQAMAGTVFGRPSFHFGFSAADFTSHTTVQLFDALPDHTYFVAPQPGDPKWKTVPPSEAEVHVDESSGDVRLRQRGSHQDLGSFARAWTIPLGFHPFHFGRAPHMPRLRCGSVIVQRQSWTVGIEDLRAGNYTGVSRDLVIALEKLRGERGFPRYIYIRPTEGALRRSGAEGRDKDTKPVFIDLESYLFLEIFYRWLVKAGELEITEMLPDPDHLCWQESDGRRTFELRTLIVPRS